MGYMFTVQDYSFRLKAERKAEALEALKVALLRHIAESDDGFMMPKPEVIQKQDTLEDLLEACWWSVYGEDDDADLNCIEAPEKLHGWYWLMWAALGPFVEKGSFIQCYGEENEQWRWFFDGKQCRSQEAKTSWVG